MTERQRKFAEYYVQCGNAEQAAVSAGYSEQYARGNAYKLVANSGVAAYIKQLSEAAQTARIMTARARQELLSDIARDEDNAAADRIRAVDTLNKMTGGVHHKGGGIGAEKSVCRTYHRRTAESDRQWISG